MEKTNRQGLPYDLSKLPRETAPFYISLSDNDIKSMLKEIGHSELKDLYNHISSEFHMSEEDNFSAPLSYGETKEHLEKLAKMNQQKTSFIGDGLKHYKVMDIVPKVCGVRGLTTAYTPYQPERSQGTLQSLWLYSSLLSMLTGFEAVNASLYERSTALFEGLQCARRIKRNKNKVLVANNIYPGDIEVLMTLQQETDLEIHFVKIDKETGNIDINHLKSKIEELKNDLAGFAFPQVNSFGLLEDVDTLTDICHDHSIESIAIVDPILLSTKGLKRPVDFGTKGGASMMVGEAQHLAIAPGFGGPGIGIFGIRYNDKNKISIRSTPGRFVSKAKDIKGKDCKVLVLSTREQHIRRDKATSNICSNQSFIATIVGASLLNRGDKGLTNSITTARNLAKKAATFLTAYEGVHLKYKAPFFNEFVLELPTNAAELIKTASQSDLQIGVDVSDRIEDSKGNHLLLSFFDIHTEEDLKKLDQFFKTHFKKGQNSDRVPEISSQYLREKPANIPHFDTATLHSYYEKLGQLNASPDDNVYALGSCTMKYNPYLNDYAANLDGFTNIHPQAPAEDVQGALQILYETQEMFKKMLGLSGVTTQPVAGAQGELVGLKMFQAYFRDRGETNRNVMLIPHSAHGTNPATASVAGFKEIVQIHALPDGRIDLEHFKKLVEDYKGRIAGVMVTNPNTSGVFETEFHEVARLVHEDGGLVYMDGANLNAIANWLKLEEMGVDAIHSNLHKTFSIPHGGGGPGDAIVACSKRVIDFLPGSQVEKTVSGQYIFVKPKKSIGSFHRHHGNFLHKVRNYTYLKFLGTKGVKQMTSVAVLSANYLYKRLKKTYPILPKVTNDIPRMHEFIITLSDETFSKIASAGIPKSEIIAKVGKLFLDFGVHAPTVSFPEVFGLMIEPTESFALHELDRFCDIVETIHKLINENPEVLKTAPHFTPIDKVDEVGANKAPVFNEEVTALPEIFPDRIEVSTLNKLSMGEIVEKILEAHKKETT